MFPKMHHDNLKRSDIIFFEAAVNLYIKNIKTDNFFQIVILGRASQLAQVASVFATSGKPSTWFPLGGLTEQKVSTQSI